MRWILYLFVLSTLGSCTSTRSLSTKFSAKAEALQSSRLAGDYTNLSTVGPRQIVRKVAGQDHKKTTLWKQLADYRTVQDTLSEVPEDTAIRLTLENKNTLRVSAYEGDELLADFSIPVKKRKNYLILKSKTRIIPIPLFYFEVKEDKAVLAPLQNGGLGIATYKGHTLQILIMGASTEALFATEYQKISQP